MFRFDLSLKADREKSIKVELSNISAWLPKSQIQILTIKSGMITVDIPYWLATERGFNCDPDHEVIGGGTAKEWRDVGEDPYESWGYDEGEF